MTSLQISLVDLTLLSKSFTATCMVMMIAGRTTPMSSQVTFFPFMDQAN